MLEMIKRLSSLNLELVKISQRPLVERKPLTAKSGAI
jgi:hypothetical protein